MSGESREGSTAHVSSQLTTLVPSFDPSKDELEQYVQKIEMLTEIWPAEKLNELATRLILNTSGAAFQKLQLQKTEILTNDRKGIECLVKALGGQWGKVTLEKKYEVVEKALFRCIQKTDESNDSYLARTDIYWTELLSKKMSMEELRSYIVLRGSLLSHEDKKRVILESDAAGSGQLSMDKVNQSVRMLGSGFFHEMIGVKKSKGKIYDAANVTFEEPEDSTWESTAFVSEEFSEEDLIDALAQEGDEDALFVSEYELAMADTVQDDSELATALTAYTDARRRLSERFRNRGFWPVNSQKGKGKGFKGKFKGAQKGQRKSLQQRILESSCRLCGRKGHWKAECPDRNKQSGSSTSSTAPTLTAEPSDPTVNHADEFLPMEFLQLPEIQETALDEPRLHTAFTNIVNLRGKRYILSGNNGDSGNHKMGKSKVTLKGNIPEPRSEQPSQPAAHAHVVREPVPVSGFAHDEPAMFSSHETFGILDTGATKSVIGSDLIPDLIQGLNPKIRQRLFRCKCSVTFRFGNQGTLDSKTALVIPLGNLGLKISIVQGQTPLLLSNTLLRTLKAQVDVAQQLLQSPMLKRSIRLKLNPRGLFLVDVNELAEAASQNCETAETFAHVDNEPENEKPEMAERPPQSSPAKTSESAKPQDRLTKSPAALGTVMDHEHKPQAIFSNTNFHKNNQDTCHNQFLNLVRNTQHACTGSYTSPQASRFKECLEKPKFVTADPIVVTQHEPFQAPGEPQNRNLWGSTCRVQGNAVGSDVQSEGRLRQGPFGQELPDNMAPGAILGSLGGKDIRGIAKDRTSEVHGLCGVDGSNGRTRGHSHIHRDQHLPSCGTAAFECQSQGTSKESASPGGPVDSPERGRCGGMDGDAAQRKHRNDQRTAGPNGLSGERHDRSPEPHPPGAEVSGDASANGHRSAGDMDHDDDVFHSFCTRPQQFQAKFQRLISQFERELQQVQCNNVMKIPKLKLLEVFCSNNSELTHQVQNLGSKAQRISLDIADLATTTGREVLFRHLVAGQPEHLWFSPTCGPWSSWSNLNGNKSLEGFALIQSQRLELLFQLALGIVLLRYQFQHGKHLHWEQPRRSAMFTTPLLHELYSKTWEANFDMCRMGELRDPVSHQLIQKSMSVRTTSMSMHEGLHGRFCNKAHQHQTLEGCTHVKGHTMKRTQFTEKYPRKFARYVAKIMIKGNHGNPKGYFEEVPVLAAEAKRKSSSARASMPPEGKRIKRMPASFSAKRQPAKLIRPDGLHLKHRRMEGKGPDTVTTELTEIMTMVKSSLPRVGKQRITDAKVLQLLQGLFENKHVVHVIACKGTERAIAPPKELTADEAPFRRAIVEVRGTQEILMEDQWEDWTHLSNRQLTRPVRASHVNITVFAANPREETSESSSVEPRPPEPNRSSPDETSPAGMPAEDQANQPAEEAVPEVQHDTRPMTIAQRSPEITDVHSKQHGSRFVALPPEERGLLARIHKNLGHPSKQVLGQVLRQKGYLPGHNDPSTRRL